MKSIQTLFLSVCLLFSSQVHAQYFEIDYDPDQFGMDVANGLELIKTESGKKLAPAGSGYVRTQFGSEKEN